MKTEQQMVADFHEAMEIEWHDDWQQQEPEVYTMGETLHALSQMIESDGFKLANGPGRLRVHLMLEELSEFIRAKTELDAVDALGDLLYVVLGTAVAYGWPAEEIFHEIHRSNMTKCVSGPRVRVKGDAYEPPNLERVLDAT